MKKIMRSLSFFGLLLYIGFALSCKVKEYPYMQKNASGRNPVYFADRYDRIPFMKRFEDGRQYSNGLAAVKQNGQWGFIDGKGETVIPFNYDWASSFGEFGFDIDIAIVKYGIDNDSPPIWTACPTELINLRGEVISQRYGFIHPIEHNLSIANNGTKFRTVGHALSMSEDGAWGCINKKGKEIVICQYELMYPFRSNITFVRKDEKWGCINERGKEIIPCIYDEVHYRTANIEINTPFDMSPLDNLDKRTIPDQKEGIIYMVSGNNVFPFNEKGRMLSTK